LYPLQKTPTFHRHFAPLLAQGAKILTPDFMSAYISL